jgi:signal transduction histidine kinase/predicted  nucleic acid-binding Zn-ribbon protein
MGIFDDAVSIITQPPGNLVYFLVSLFALQQAFVSALSARRAMPGASPARRWAWSAGGMLLVRVGLMIAGLLGVAGLIVPEYLLPPLESWFITAGALVLIWATLLSDRARRWQTTVLIVLLILTLAFYGYGIVLRAAPDQAYLVWDVALWEPMVAAVALTVFLILTVALRPPEWEWALGVALFWLLGTVAQMLWSTPAMPVDGWQRLASLVALPLVSILAHRQLLAAPRVEGTTDQLPDITALSEIVQSVASARDLDPALIVASSKIANFLGVDICAITLDAEDEAESVRLIAVHPPTAAELNPPHLHLPDYPGLQTAYATHEPTITNRSAKAPWLAPLYEELGFEKPEPLAALALRHQDRNLGILLLGGPGKAGGWRERDLGTPGMVADMLAKAIVEAGKNKDKVEMLAEREASQGNAEDQKLEAAIGQAKAQIKALNERIRTLLQEIKARDKEILALNSELESQQASTSEAELEIWQAEVRQLAEERESLHKKANELIQDRDMLLTERGRLSNELVNAKQQLEQVESHRERLEDEVKRMKAKMSQVQQRFSALQADLKDAQEELAASSEAAVLQGAVGLIIVDEEGVIMTADALARQMLRLPEGNVIGMPINGAFPHPEWSQTVGNLLTLAEPDESEQPQPSRAHLSLALENGNTVEADLAALRGRNGAINGLAITLRSSESDAERHEAIVSLANEFRTPMTAMTGYTDLLLGEQAGILTEMQQKFLERVKANVEQLNQLLNDMIQIASPDTRPMEMSPQSVDLIEIIEDAIMGLAARFQERKLAIQLDLPSELASVEADRDSLYQIMLRLLSNAVLCSETGTQVVVTAKEVTYPEGGKHLRISVTDTGGGIHPDDYPRVFRRFYRANQPLVEGMGETGVGMAVAKALVEANGGRIWVESEAGEGSTFSFLLPAES